jgi:hypothetical protein
MINSHHISCDIIPQFIMRDGKLHKITKISEEYRIKEFEVITENDIIKSVNILNSFHPNACDGVWDGTINGVSTKPPSVCTFCLPNHIKDKKLTEENLYVIKKILSMINFDNCYYFDYSIEYVKSF